MSTKRGGPGGPNIALASYSERRPLRRDDLPLRDALEARGVSVTPIVWDEHEPDWSKLDGCLIRSVSDYHVKYAAFVAWLKRVEELTTLWNPLDIMLWNVEKTYLRDLADNGVPTIPTRWIDRDDKVCLADVLEELNWREAIIKPSIGLGGQNLYRVRLGESEGQQAIERLLLKSNVLLQPFLPSVKELGETSLIYIDGKFAHAVRKRPAAGEFRVQGTWGGTSAPCEPTAAEIEVALAAFGTLDTIPLYGRADLVANASRKPCLVELELVEPDLFFEHNLASASLLADAIASRVSS